jgi:hypothetical protein
VDLRYKHIERGLAAALDIKPGEMAAFRARLLYLRNMGVPKLPSVGSGQQIAYTERHALEIFLAIQFERGGQAPKNAAQFARTIVNTLPPFFGPNGELRLDEYVARQKSKELHAGDIRIAVEASDQPTCMWVEGWNNEMLSVIEQQFMEERPGRKRRDQCPPFLIVNISAWIKRLQLELKRVLDAG